MAETPKSAGEVTLDVVPTMMSGAIQPDAVILDHIQSDTPNIRYFAAVSEDGLQVQKFDEEELQAIPRRPKGERQVSDLASFLNELYRRPLGDAGTMWGNAARGEIIAVYNDHTDVLAGWRDDTLRLTLKKDQDWDKWHSLSGKYFRQSEFGDLVEDLLHTVVAPDQADLLEIIDSIRASTKGEFENTIVRANGAQTVTFNTEVQTAAGRTRQLEVPQTITLRLRPWEGHESTYDIEAYFRLKIEGSQLNLSVKLKPTRQIIRTAWDEITAEIIGGIDKPVYSAP